MVADRKSKIRCDRKTQEAFHEVIVTPVISFGPLIGQSRSQQRWSVLSAESCVGKKRFNATKTFPRLRDQNLLGNNLKARQTESTEKVQKTSWNISVLKYKTKVNEQTEEQTWLFPQFADDTVVLVRAC